MNNSKVLILFPEGNLPYSPSTLNLISTLSDQFEVSVIANVLSEKLKFEKSHFRLIRLNVVNKDANNILLRVFIKIIKRLSKKNSYVNLISETEMLNYIRIKKFIKALKPNFIIAVDLFALYCCQRLNLRCIFLSFEIPSKSIYYSLIDFKNIDRVIIQSVARYNYLFKEIINKPEYFILPNAPKFEIPTSRTVPSKNIVYNGNIWSAFGPQFCMTFITKYSDYRLSIKGAVTEDIPNIYFPFLINSGNIVVNNDYLNESEIKQYLTRFSIGFCFYNFEHPFIKMNRFNYETGPAGKLYHYLNVGLPVICTNIIAFKFVENNNAGILVDDYSPNTIKNAIDKILFNYQFYSDNALKLGEESCFEKNSRPIIEYLINENIDRLV